MLIPVSPVRLHECGLLLFNKTYFKLQWKYTLGCSRVLLYVPMITLYFSPHTGYYRDPTLQERKQTQGSAVCWGPLSQYVASQDCSPEPPTRLRLGVLPPSLKHLPCSAPKGQATMFLACRPRTCCPRLFSLLGKYLLFPTPFAPFKSPPGALLRFPSLNQVP